jgi:flagellar biosynthesis anti-sigma factor FlgM
MNNGITTLQNLVGSQQISGSAPVAHVKAPVVQPVEGQTDQTSLSSAGDLVAKAIAGADATSDVRLDKVSEIQKAIADGTYYISASDVAGKIVDSLLG